MRGDDSFSHAGVIDLTDDDDENVSATGVITPVRFCHIIPLCPPHAASRRLGRSMSCQPVQIAELAKTET